VITLRKKPLSFSSIKKNLPYLCLSGIAIGFNWILLFESYRYTSVAVSTLCYYMAPIIVIVASPFLLRERLTIKKIVCVLVALLGMICISGIGNETANAESNYKGILLGLGAAVLYASVMLLNKKLEDIGSFDKTILQLFIAALTMIPYNIVIWEPITQPVTLLTIVLLVTVGAIHTGFAYYLYFGAMEHLNAQSIAITSYIDPLVAVVASVLLLHEPITWLSSLGAILILGAAVFSEIPLEARRRQP
jgi:drug/metabolite transporter (DMT)-like permease